MRLAYLVSMVKQEKGGYKIYDPYGTYFVTFTIVGWVDVFTRKECKDIVINSLKYCQENKGLVVNAFVIMGSHIHLVLRSDDSIEGLSNIIRDMKKYIAKEIINWLKTNNHESRKDWMLHVFKYYAKKKKNTSKYQVWIHNNQPKQLLHPKFTKQKLSYLHYNPVEARIVDKPDDYLYSRARNYMSRSDFLLEVEILDFEIEEGYLPM